MFKYVWISLGFLSLTLGIIGIVLPLVPTTPFLLLTLFSFSKGSPKFHAWFKKTKLYRDYIESYQPGREIPIRKKVEIVCSVFIITGLSFYFFEILYVRIILASVFFGHLVYFFIIQKTKS